jgi:hypothetical protein
VVLLLDFSLVSPDIQSEELLKAIETAIPVKAIEQAMPTAGYAYANTHSC